MLIEEDGNIHHYADSWKFLNIFGLCLKRSWIGLWFSEYPGGRYVLGKAASSLLQIFSLRFFQLFRHCCFFNHNINQTKEITWSYQMWKKKMQGDFSAGSSSVYNPNFILCFLSKSSLLKYHLDKGIWFRKGVWHLVKHLTLCQIITEKLSEIHSWIISINCVTTSCPSTGDNVFHTSGKHEGSICVRKLGSRQKYLFQKNLLADWWGGEDSSSYIKRTSSQRD